jgi:phage protein D
VPLEEERQRATPAWKVTINGSDLDRDIELEVLSVVVDQYVDGPDAFSVTVNVWNGMNQELRWIDDGAFPEGSEVEISMGYGEDLEKMIVGEIVALELEAGSDMPPILRVEGYDKLHRFRRGKRTRSFSEIKDSQVAEQIAQEMQLTPDVEDSEIVHPYLCQYNQTDIDFLQERALRINYELLIVDGTLHFRKAANYLGKVEELFYGGNLKSLTVRLSTLSQVSQVVVKGWNPISKEAIVGLGQSGDETTKMGGNDLGVAIATDAFGESKRVILDKPIFNQAEADQMAKAMFNSMSLQFIQGEGEALGDPLLRAGQVVEIVNLGERFSGLHYLKSTHHVIDSEGYLTRFTCQRNATT